MSNQSVAAGISLARVMAHCGGSPVGAVELLVRAIAAAPSAPEPYAALTELRQDLPRDVGRILRRCLAKDPDDRYQTAKELRNDLRSLKEDLDTGVATRAPTSSQTTQAAGLQASGPRVAACRVRALCRIPQSGPVRWASRQPIRFPSFRC